MTGMLIGSTNRFDDATLDASGEALGLPVENMQVNPLKKTWRVESGTAWIDITHATSSTMRVFALMAAGQGNDLTSAATIRIRCSDTSTTTGDILDTGVISAGVISGYPHVYHVLAAEISAKFCRIDIVSSLSIIDIGRGYVGPVWEPTRNHSFGRGVSWADDSNSVRSEGGQIITGIGARFRVFDFALDFNSEAEMMTNAFELDREKGINDDILVMLDPDTFPQKLSLFGPVVRVTQLLRRDGGIVSKRYQVEERL